MTIQSGFGNIINPDSIKELNPGEVSSSSGNEQPGSGSGSFANTLLDSIKKVNDMQTEANNQAEAIAAGTSSNIHQAMIDMEKANDSFELMMQIRNKIVTAYNTIMQMQV